MNNNNNSGVLSFIYARIPNFEEVKINAWTKSGLDLVLGRVIDSFGLNPTAANVFRDGLKTFTNFQLIGVESGSTGIIHDYAGFYGAIIKTTCKATLLGGYVYLDSTQEHLPSVARSANYVCEIMPRYLNIASREKQLWEKNNPTVEKEAYFSYLSSKSQINWWVEAFMASFTKTLTSDMVGEYVIKPLGYQQYIRKQAAELESNVFSHLTSLKNIFALKDDIYSKGAKILSSFEIKDLSSSLASLSNTLKAAGAFSCVISTDFTFSFAKEMLNSYIFITSTKTLQDVPNLLMNYFSPPEVAKNTSELNILTNNTIVEQVENVTLAGEHQEL
jgi:hypothetical protein